jgi:ADP-ribosyl-[dinitrogen reductase] hydrolase
MKKSDQAISESWKKSDIKITCPKDVPIHDRIVGSIMGCFVGDALGLGCHWYYDFNDLWKDCGTWVDDYLDPKPFSSTNMSYIHKHRYDMGVRAGYNSQTGQLIQILLESVAGKGEFDVEDYTLRLDNFFKKIDGSALSGRFTDRAVREAWNAREKGVTWQSPEIGSGTSTSDAGQYAIVLAGLYRNPSQLAGKAYQLSRLWYNDPAFISYHVVYALIVQGIINGILIEEMCDYLIEIGVGFIDNYISSYDDLTLMAYALDLVQRPNILPLQDDRFISRVYGPDCHSAHLFPAAYYLAFKYAKNFENAILFATNSGGNNMARAALTGGLTGAMTGINSIPKRFISGLKDKEKPDNGNYLLGLANSLAEKTII